MPREGFGPRGSPFSSSLSAAFSQTARQLTFHAAKYKLHKKPLPGNDLQVKGRLLAEPASHWGDFLTNQE